MLWTPHQIFPASLMRWWMRGSVSATVARKRLRRLLMALADPEVWLRACAIAALRERDGITLVDLANRSGPLGTGNGCAHTGMDLARTGGGCDAPPQTGTSSVDRQPDRAVVFSALRSVPVPMSKGADTEVGACLGRQPPSANSPSAGSRRPRGWVAMRPPRPSARRLEERACLWAATWVVRVARVLAKQGLLDRRGALLAVRLSSRLSRRAWATYRAERKRRRAEIWREANEASSPGANDKSHLSRTKAGFKDNGDSQ